jgi:hypothetical protein
MTLTVSGLRRYPGAMALDRAEVRSRSVRRRVAVVWFLLFFNTLTYVGGVSVLDLPSKVGKAIAQGSLPLAILIALSVNPKLKVRPNVFLCIMSLLIVDTVLTAAQVHHIGTIYRTFRLAEYLIALWLLTPWWGRRDMLLFRCHIRCLYIALVSVFIGMLISPGRAFSYQGGRLVGDIWPMFPTQVAQYAAVATGLTIVLWLARLLSGRITLIAVAFDIAILLLTHTRTALIALAAGLLVAGLSLFTVNARVRKFFATGAAVVSVAVLTAAGFLVTWLARGESAQGLTSLTGRTDFWSLVLNTPRDRFEEIFGFGLSNASINGLPIDSNWLSAYMQEGFFGVVVCGLAFVFILLAAFFKSTGTRRAIILFLGTYCLIASFTEDSITDVSPYLLNLVVAASLLMANRPRPAREPAGEIAFTPEELAEIGR